MKKLKKVGKCSKSKSKKRIIFLRLRRNHKRKTKLINPLMKGIPEILSPHNTTGYLIANNSSSFYPEEEEDLDIDLTPDPFSLSVDAFSDLIKTENQSLEIKEPQLLLELESTAPQSQDLSESKLSFE